MTQQNEKMNEILKDPSAAYATPQEVINDDGLNEEQKERVLQCWEEDERAKQRAASENMPSPSDIETTGTALSLISQLRGELGAKKN